MELNNSKQFYLKLSKLDEAIFIIVTILLRICYITNTIAVTDLKSYLNRRILYKLLKDHPNRLIYLETFKGNIDFKFFGYTITYDVKAESFNLSKYDEIFFIHYYNEGDTKIVSKIVDILKKKYHEHQEELIEQACI